MSQKRDIMSQNFVKFRKMPTRKATEISFQVFQVTENSPSGNTCQRRSWSWRCFRRVVEGFYIISVYPPPRMPVTNEGLVRDSLQKMVHNPGGDWNPGWGGGSNISYHYLPERPESKS